MRYGSTIEGHPGAGLVLGLLGLAAASASSSDWPQFNLDARHSGASLQETSIHRGNVSTLHVLYNVALPSIADGAPAIRLCLRTRGQGAQVPRGRRHGGHHGRLA